MYDLFSTAEHLPGSSSIWRVPKPQLPTTVRTPIMNEPRSLGSQSLQSRPSLGPAPSREGKVTGVTDKRGKHSRAEAKRKRSHAQIAWEHLQAVKGTNGFSMVEECSAGCPQKGECRLHYAPKRLIRAHEASFGPTSETTAEQQSDGTWENFQCGNRSKDTHKVWRDLAMQAVSRSAADDTTQVRLLVDGEGPVCHGFWAQAYGIPAPARLLAAARAGRLQGEAELADMFDGLHDAEDDDQNYSQRREDAINWWVDWLRLEDQMPNEETITHRAVIWQAVYHEEYCIDMDWWSASKPLSPTRWRACKIDALKMLSVEFYGEQPEQPGVPLVDLKLKQRANHSNFGSCAKCTRDKGKWTLVRRNRHAYGADELRQLRIDIFKHAHECRLERRLAAQMFQDACGRSGVNAQYDDKCGSSYAHIPSPPGGREDGDTATRYKYRTGLQGNLFVGELLRISIVPPNLRTGANFGCSAYLSGLLELKRMGLLAPEQIRQTDSGPDNDAAATHAFHCSLIHWGAMKRMAWIRLHPKHSHNLADRYNAMIKEVVQPRSGASDQGGCNAPWDLDAVIQRALRTQKGKVQLAWHLINFDFADFFKGCIPDFEKFSQFRYWEYEYDPTLPEHGYVRVRYRESILPTPEGEPALKPYHIADDGSMSMKPEGLMMMTHFPPLDSIPRKETWVPAERLPSDEVPEPEAAEPRARAKSTGPKPWKMKKVLSDILNHRAKKFTPDQCAQWCAIKEYHEAYQTSDAVPDLPIALQAPAGAGEPDKVFNIEHGMPVAWKTIRETLFTYERPHTPGTNPGATDAVVEAADSGTAETHHTRALAVLPPAERAAFMNKVTSKAAAGSAQVLARAEKLYNFEREAHELGDKEAKPLTVGDLVFLELDEFEGEFKVSMVRICRVFTASCGTKMIDVHRLRPQGHEQSSHAFRWKQNQTFVANEVGDEASRTASHPCSRVLPVPVALTKTSAHHPTESLVADIQSIRLQKRCVDLLRRYLSLHRPELQREVEEAEGESDNASDSAESVEAGPEEWAKWEVGSWATNGATFLPWANIVGSDVCVLPAAFPDSKLTRETTIGWRGIVQSKRGSAAKDTQQIQVYGGWFKLRDQTRILPIKTEGDIRIDLFGSDDDDPATPMDDGAAEPAAESATEAVTEPAAKSATEAVTDPAAESATEAVTDPAAKPATEDDSSDSAESVEANPELPPPVSYGPPAGTIVWARAPRFPFWPAAVEAPTVEGPQPPKEVRSCFVRFFGTRDVAWVVEGDVVRFPERPDLCDAKLTKKSLRQKYKCAVDEARRALQ
jgi:hypothetical protein